MASCSAHKAHQGREIFLGALMPSEGSETADGKSPYLEKQKTIIRGQNTTKEMRKRGGKLYWGTSVEERYSHRSQSCLGIQTAGYRVGGQGAAVQPHTAWSRTPRPALDGQGPSAHPA